MQIALYFHIENKAPPTAGSLPELKFFNRPSVGSMVAFAEPWSNLTRIYHYG